MDMKLFSGRLLVGVLLIGGLAGARSAAGGATGAPMAPVSSSARAAGGERPRRDPAALHAHAAHRGPLARPHPLLRARRVHLRRRPRLGQRRIAGAAHHGRQGRAASTG